MEMSELGKMAKEKRWAMWNFVNGLQTLPATLSKWVTDQGAEVHLNSPCKHLDFEKDGVKVRFVLINRLLKT